MCLSLELAGQFWCRPDGQLIAAALAGLYHAAISLIYGPAFGEIVLCYGRIAFAVGYPEDLNVIQAKFL